MHAFNNKLECLSKRKRNQCKENVFTTIFPFSETLSWVRRIFFGGSDILIALPIAVQYKKKYE